MSENKFPHAIIIPANEIDHGALEEEISMAPIEEGPETAFERVISNDDGGFLAIWEAKPGVYPRVKDKRGSVMYILSGKATVTDVDGTANELTAGSILLLPYRWQGTWFITETIRKVYVYSWPQGEPSVKPAKGICYQAPDFQKTEPALLSAQNHGLTFPDFKAEVISDGVDGLTGMGTLAQGSYDVAPSGRWTYLYIESGSVQIEDSGNRLTAGPGSLVFLPLGWEGKVEVAEDLRFFFFFTDSKK